MSKKPAKVIRAAPIKGHVEAFSISDEQYFVIYLDGQEVEFLGKQSLSSYLLLRSVRRELAKQAGVNEEDLRFSYSRPFWRAQKLGLEMSDVPYEDMAAWRTTHPDQFDFFALNVDEMEQAVALGDM